MADPELWDGKRMAWLLGISGRRMRQLVEEGVVEAELVHVGKREVRRYDPVRTARSYYEYILRDKRAPTAEEVEESKQRYETARADLFEARAEAARYQNDVATGKLIYAKEVTEDLKRFFVAFKAFALAFPAQLISRFEGLVAPDELRGAERDMRASVVDRLREFAGAPIEEKDDDEE